MLYNLKRMTKMKKYIVAVAALLMVGALYAQEPSKTLVVVDGKVVPKAEFDALDPDQIQNIDIFKNIEGAIVVTTKKALPLEGDVKSIKIAKEADEKLEITTVHINKETGTATVEKKEENVVFIGGEGSGARVMHRSEKATAVANPLILLQVKEGQWKELTSEEMKQIDPGLIKAISVLKDKEAIEKFMDYENAKNGVIVIEMKELKKRK